MRTGFAILLLSASLDCLCVARRQATAATLPPAQTNTITLAWDYAPGFVPLDILKLNVYSSTNMTWTKADTNVVLTWEVENWQTNWPSYAVPIVYLLPRTTNNLPPVKTWPLLASISTTNKRVTLPRTGREAYYAIAVTNTLTHLQSDYASR